MERETRHLNTPESHEIKESDLSQVVPEQTLEDLHSLNRSHPENPVEKLNQPAVLDVRENDLPDGTPMDRAQVLNFFNKVLSNGVASASELTDLLEAKDKAS